GGKVIFSPEGDTNIKADVVIAVYGEDPYAEFQGDVKHLDFVPNGFDVNKLNEFKNKGIPVVSVFLSGRPMWTNPEINASDAFVAAWLPGSEGGGVADMLFQTDPSYKFTGRLSFSWPNTAIVDGGTTKPLFALGYGLTNESTETVALLSEESGLDRSQMASTGQFYSKGAPVAPWELKLNSGSLVKQVASFPTSVGGLIISKTDHKAQEDALRIKWTKADYDQVRLSAGTPSDMSRQMNGAMELAFFAKSFGGDKATIKVGMGCNQEQPCDKTLDIVIGKEWKEYRISLSCFGNMGVDMTQVSTAMMITAGEGMDIGLGEIRLETDIDTKPGCDGN
ncbi:MAG: putative glycoside hydrolase, partial [Cytophagaceae bacterium]